MPLPSQPRHSTACDDDAFAPPHAPAYLNANDSVYATRPYCELRSGGRATGRDVATGDAPTRYCVRSCHGGGGDGGGDTTDIENACEVQKPPRGGHAAAAGP